MSAVGWMISAGVAPWAIVSLVAEPNFNPAALAGMLGPLVSVCLTWIVITRTHARRPERLMRVMVAGAGVKIVAFGLYVFVMLQSLELDPLSFMVSFTASFVMLYGLEAVFLQRLLLTGARQASRA